MSNNFFAESNVISSCFLESSYKPMSLHVQLQCPSIVPAWGEEVLVPTDEPQSNFKCHNSCIHTYVYTCSVVVVPEFLLRCVVESGQFIPLKYSRQEIAGIPFGNFSWEISTH